MLQKVVRFGCVLFTLVICCCLLAACHTEADPFAQSGIQSLTVDKKEQVKAEVSLAVDDVQAHTGKKAGIYELLPGESVSVLADRAPLDEVKVRAHMSFSFPLMDGERSRLYSSFVLGFSDGTFLSPEGYWIENPQHLAGLTSAFLWTSSPKGLVIENANDAALMGCMHAMLEVRLSALLGGGEPVSFAGQSYTVSAEVLASLDAQIRSASEAGMQVSLSVSPDSFPSLEHAVAALDLLCSRYAGGDLGTVSAIFVDAPVTLDASTAAYLCRVANQALCSRVADGRVYVTSHAATLSGATSFFTALRDTLSAGGELQWGAAIAPVTSAAPWQALGEDAMTVDRIATLKEALGYKGNATNAAWFAVCGLNYSAEDEAMQAVSYAYAYRASVAVAADLIFYASHVDDNNGIYSANGTPRRLASVFSSIDCGLSAADRLLCEQVAGEAWTQEASDFSSRAHVTGVASAGENETGEETVLFDFATGELYGFTGVENSGALSSNQSGTWNAPVLYTWLSPAVGNAGGVRKILNDATALKNTSSMSFRLLTQATGAEQCTVTLCLEGETENGERLTYQSEVAVTNGQWQTVTFQIANFTVDADLSRPCVLTLTTSPDEHATEEQHVLWLKDIRIRQLGRDFGVWIPVVIIAGGIAVGLTAVLLLYRRTSKRRW